MRKLSLSDRTCSYFTKFSISPPLNSPAHNPLDHSTLSGLPGWPLAPSHSPPATLVYPRPSQARRSHPEHSPPPSILLLDLLCIYVISQHSPSPSLPTTLPLLSPSPQISLYFHIHGTTLLSPSSLSKPECAPLLLPSPLPPSTFQPSILKKA